MRTRFAISIVAASTSACIGFAGLGDDPDEYVRRPGSSDDAGTNADSSISDSGLNDASAVDASGGDAGGGSDVDACVSEALGELTTRLCGARVCGPASGTDACGVQRTVQCGTCGSNLTCDSNGSCGCSAESTADLVAANCGSGSCGDLEVTDRCGGRRTISCGSTCAGQGETCGGGNPGTANVCGCTPETAGQFCARYGKNCSTFSGPDNCGVRRTNVACGTCTLPQTCAGAGTAGVCGCTPTTCVAQGKNCGQIPDECGGTLNCGGCSGTGQTCGGGVPAVANVCGCTPESDQALCTLEGAACGSITTADRCGASRTVASCGTCSGTGVTCGGGGTPKQCGCTPESNAAFCTRLGADCGAKGGTDNCGQARSVANCGTCANGGTCSAQNTCPWVGSTGELGARTASMTGDGLNNCGPNGDDNCARSPLVTGGTFNRGAGTSYPATISDFRLDKYEVTKGRFRKFVDAWVGGWRPPVASGKHTHLNGGTGLANTAGGNEPGWDATWTAYVGAPSNGGVAPTGAGATTKADWDSNLQSQFECNWQSAPSTAEKKPVYCLSWYDLHAFCIWDGGFLPSDAEWEYAAAGGSDERTYPWGNTSPGSDASLAIYGCYYNGTGTCSLPTNIAPVGTVAAGAGRWGQHDLAGNVYEWNLDWYQGDQNPYVTPCSNCTNLTSNQTRILRGGSAQVQAFFLSAALREGRGPANRGASGGIPFVGGRCARSP
jgi:sulfatase modifying factor 1